MMDYKKWFDEHGPCSVMENCHEGLDRTTFEKMYQAFKARMLEETRTHQLSDVIIDPWTGRPSLRSDAQKGNF